MTSQRSTSSSHRDRPRPANSQSGFTIIELVIAVAIVAILAAIAIPAYSTYVTRGKLTEAFNNLSSYALSLEQFYQDNRSYVGGCTATPPTSANFTYVCTLGATSYTLTASGSAALTSGFTFSLTNSGARATTTAPSGWQTSANCWINSKSGACQ